MEARRHDLDLPRAPSQEEWDRLSPEEQQRVVEALPSEFMLAVPEGDPHRHAKEHAFQALDEHFRQIRRRVYLSSIVGESVIGWRLHGDRYETTMPTAGRVASRVLGLDLAVVQGRLCFYLGAEQLPDGRALIDRLSTMVDGAVHRAEAEAHRADRLAARLRELGVDPE